MNSNSTASDREDLAELTFSRYEKFINPGLATLTKFMGFEGVEVAAEGCYVTASDGKRYLDCWGGPGVFTMGHCHPQVVQAIQQQAAQQPLGSHILLNPIYAELAERLAEITPGDLQYCFVCNSGAEAVEAALKFARGCTERPKFVAAEGAFHGKTFGALSASGRDVYKQPFEPLLEGFTHVPFGDAKALAEAVDDQTAAVILEPIQCEAGIIIPPEGYLTEARQICNDSGALLIFDEIQTGLGRTGRMFACDWEEVAPDIITLGKALGGGVMPIGAAIATPQVWTIFEDSPIIHSSTFGGNPLACAAALAALEVLIEENLANKCAQRGEQLLAGIAGAAADYPEMINAVRGKGLLVGVEFTDSDLGGLTITALAQRQILAAFALNDPRVLRFEPPAIISAQQVDQVIQAVGEALAQTAELIEM